MPADYHTHTPLCHHAEGTPKAYVERAVAAGLDEYGISDHAPQTPEPFDDWRMAMADLPRYLDWIAEAKQHAAGRLTVRAGLECDWLPNCQAHLETLTAAHHWDYLIGSVHYLSTPATERWDFDNPKHLSQWQTFSPSELEEVWTIYWKAYTAMVRSGHFDIYGHPDLIKKFAHHPEGDLRRFYDPVIEALAESGKAIEINTAGWHKPCAEQYPAAPFLSLAAQAGIPLTINSDAHRPEEVGRDFPKAYALAREAGFTQVALFEQRRMSLTALEED
jgi:histidinol-phosphatase (PHP family)